MGRSLGITWIRGSKRTIFLGGCCCCVWGSFSPLDFLDEDDDEEVPWDIIICYVWIDEENINKIFHLCKYKFNEDKGQISSKMVCRGYGIYLEDFCLFYRAGHSPLSCWDIIRIKGSYCGNKGPVCIEINNGFFVFMIKIPTMKGRKK